MSKNILKKFQTLEEKKIIKKKLQELAKKRKNAILWIFQY